VTEQLLRVYIDVARYSQSTHRPVAQTRKLVALPEARR